MSMPCETGGLLFRRSTFAGLSMSSSKEIPDGSMEGRIGRMPGT